MLVFLKAAFFLLLYIVSSRLTILPSLRKKSTLLFTLTTRHSGLGHAVSEIAVHILQLSLNTFLNYCSLWKIRLNPTKTQATVFSRFKTNRHPINRLKIYDQTINWSDHISYLGVTLSNNFSFTSHYASTLNKAKIRMAILRPILKASTLNFESKLAILRTLVFSIFLVCRSSYSA